jgi:hypothetical protein
MESRKEEKFSEYKFTILEKCIECLMNDETFWEGKQVS